MLINPEVRIEVTNKCNGKCLVCPREKMTRKMATMDMGLFRRNLLQSAILGATDVGLFGFGEPLLDPKLHEKIKLCTTLGLKSFITTNATLLPLWKVDELLEAGLDRIRFSIHGISDSYEKVQPGFKWKTTLRNIFDFAKINKLKYNHSCEMDVTAIPMHGESIEHIKNLWKDMDGLEIWQPHNWTNGKRYRNTSSERSRTCGRPFSGPIQINADGKMMVCCFDYDAKLTIGDTTKQDIKDILSGEKINKIRKAHKTGNLTGLICQKCDQLNIGDKPLLYSSRDESCEIGKTSSIKFKLEET